MDRPRSLTIVLLINSVAFATIVVLGFLYINHVDQKRAEDERQNDQQWCELIVTLDEAYKEQAPTNATGRRLAELMHRRRETLGCP